MLKIKSLQMKLTLIVGGILVLAGLMLTASSIYNANNSFVEIHDTIIGTTIGTTQADEITGSTDISKVPEGVVSDGGDYLAKPVLDEIAYTAQIVPIRQQFAYSSITYLVAIILIGIIIAFVAINNAFKPMKRLNRTIQHIDAHHLSVRVEEGQGEDEVSQFAKAFNHMLERLEKVFQMQKNFASSAAHELKTPIAVMKTSMQVLALDEAPTVEDYKENMEIMKQEVEKLRLIVEDLFQLNSGRQIDFKEVVSLEDLLGEIQMELEQADKINGVKIDFKVAEVILYGSRNLIHRALFNLIENAIKYNHLDGSVMIYTEVNEGLEIHIKDTGIGMDDEALRLIYEPFYRGVDSMKLEKKGVGLGLSIVKNIIDQHGWCLEANSQVGIGSEFIMKVPREDYEEIK